MTALDDDGIFPSLQTSEYVRGQRRGGTNSRRRTILVRASGALLLLLILCLAFAGVIAHQVVEVRTRLEETMILAHQLRTDVSAKNYDEAQQTVDQIRRQVADARSITTGPLWKAASVIPIVGPNFEAVSEVTVSADDIATRAAAPLLDTYESFNWQGLSPVNGRIDIEELQEVSPTIATAANTVRLSLERMTSIDQSSLLPQVAEPIHAVTEQLREANDALSSVSSGSMLLPTMLGSDDPRSYLILVQNNAEARATGGIPGALATLNTDDGRISMGVQSSASALGAFKPPLEVDREQVALFTGRLGTQMQNVNLTPDFPTAALTAKRMWEERHREESLDGVIALDPVVLGHLLNATGPVTLSDPSVLKLIDGTSLPMSLNKDNVVSTLLSDVYREIEDPVLQDIYFASVASQVFDAFTAGEGDSVQLLKALTTSVQENRLFLWSSHPDEQDIIASTPLANSVIGPEGGGASFGVYFNDGTGAKMDYYATRNVQLIRACPVAGYGQYTVRVTATNNAPSDAASSLPAYVTGGGIFGVESGRIRTNYVVYGPAQAFVETATVDGQPVPVSSGRHGQRAVGAVSLELSPGESATIDILFSKVVQYSEPHIRVTPTIQSLKEVVLPLERELCG